MWWVLFAGRLPTQRQAAGRAGRQASRDGAAVVVLVSL